MIPARVGETPGADADSFPEAVAALYQAHFASLFRYLDRLTGDPDLAKDLAQDTFVRLHRRGALPDDPRAWLAAVATNLLRDHQRQARRRAELVVEYAGDAAPPSERPAADAAIMVHEAQSQVRAALDALPERDRMLLLLRHEGYSYRELAHAANVAEGSVGTLLVRATRLFRNAVGAASLIERERAATDGGADHASD
jgi:RNA polymerase sigma-70 factor (ECF subfamily)